MSVTYTYYVALPFVRTGDGVAAGQGQECPNEPSPSGGQNPCRGIRANAGALAFKRTGDPNMGSFADATILKTFGDISENLDEL